MYHRVALAISEHVSLFELAAPCAIFGCDPDVLGGRPWYDFAVCGAAGAPIDRWFAAGNVEPYATLHDADTVIVPACHDGNFRPPEDLVRAVRVAHARGARVVSICTGAFVLAEAGLLDGRRATTHWMHAPTLAERFPNIDVDPEPLFVDHGDVATSAGKSAGTDLCLHLVRHDLGAQAANQVARVLVAPPHRDGNQRQYVDQLPLPHSSDELGSAMVWAAENLHELPSVEDLARRAGISVRTLHRQFLDRIGLKPSAWLSAQRVRRSQQLLETTNLTVERIADLSGFGSAAAMRRSFREQMNTTPDAYRRAFTVHVIEEQAG